MSAPVTSSTKASPATRESPALRVRPSTARAFGGIWRLSVRRFFNPMRWLVLAGMLVLLVLFSLPAAPNREAAVHGFLPWAARFYVCFLVPVLAFLSAAGAVRDDLQAGAVDYLFTRPVRRPTFLFLRYLAHVICTQLDFLPSLGVVIGIGVYREVPGLSAAVPALLLGQVLVIIAFSAFGFLSAMLTSRYVILGLVYGGLIEVGMGNVPTQLSRLSMVRQALSVLTPALDGQKIGMGGPLGANPLSAPSAVMLLLGISAAMLGVAALIFAWRELAGASGREP